MDVYCAWSWTHFIVQPLVSPNMARACNYWFETVTLELDISNLVNSMQSSCEHSAYIGERHHQNTTILCAVFSVSYDLVQNGITNLVSR